MKNNDIYRLVINSLKESGLSKDEKTKILTSTNKNKLADIMFAVFLQLSRPSSFVKFNINPLETWVLSFDFTQLDIFKTTAYLLFGLMEECGLSDALSSLDPWPNFIHPFGKTKKRYALIEAEEWEVSWTQYVLKNSDRYEMAKPFELALFVKRQPELLRRYRIVALGELLHGYVLWASGTKWGLSACEGGNNIYNQTSKPVRFLVSFKEKKL